ncbi:hypothetical protein [Methyloversatilis discipulorum]|uniref:hypothetical protein n=1 Tax=Methyloversatilis discipulorum TaxID=1119528 RepID=UPI0003744266|nr:hypothetical protein [Methyloversatilis discipulorum]
MNNHRTPINDLQDAKLVPFDKIHLDPNNPRIAPESPPGYLDDNALFAEDLQQSLEERVRAVYDVANLEDSILAHGWVPIDSIIVWEHSHRPGHYIVVEGNTRTVALRTLRGSRLERERKKLEKLKKAPSRFEEELRVQQDLVDRLENIASQTDQLRVFPVAAKSVDELQAILPRLLGVRHISHAREWKPYATNLYILSLYERLFRARHGDKVALRLEDDLVNEVASMVSLGGTRARRNIQAASAFTHFKRDYEDRLPEGEALSDEDHYFFELILQNAYPKEQFNVNKDSLRLPKESEEVLFQWAFSKPRSGKEEDNENIFYKAESVRLWNQMATYDGKCGTNFAKQLDVNSPDEARPIGVIEAEFLQHKTQRTPIDALTSLLKALQDLKVDTLLSQQEHLTPILDRIAHQVARYQKMMKAVSE